MVDVLRFSQFPGPSPILPTDIVVGLRNGQNYQFSGVGSGGGTGVTVAINQPGHGLVAGNWVRIDSTGNFVKAIATDPENAEIAGLVVSVADINNFTLQVVGYVGPGTFINLIPGRVYFLSDAVLGLMTLDEPVIDNEVSINVFCAWTDQTGFVRQSRGITIGGEPSPGSGSNPDDPNIVSINQIGHGLNEGDVVRLSGSINYVPAIATTLANAQAVGVVIQVVDLDNFVLQTSGYNVGAITQDDGGGALVPGTVYYLSATMAGKVHNAPPVAVGQASKPMLIAEQAGGTPAGYILEQRPLEITSSSSDPAITTINQAGHGFLVGQWLYITGSLTYARGIANSLASSQVVGVVTSVIDVDNFVLQSSGYNVGAVTLDAGGIPVVPGNTYYLSPTVLGAITNVAPTTAGQFTKPLFTCEQTFGITGIYAGYILEQRPLPADTGVGGNGLIFLGSVSVVNQATLNLDNLLSATYDNYKIVLENFGAVNTNTVFRMRVGTGLGPTYQVVNYAGVTCIPNVGAPGAQTSGTTAFDLTLVGRTTNAAASIAGEILIGNVNSGNAKNVTGLGIYRDNIGGTTPWGWIACMQWQNAAPVTSLQFLFGAGNIATGTAKLYGYQN